MSLLQDVLYVLTDGLHKSGFKQQTMLLGLLFQVVITDYVTLFFHIFLTLIKVTVPLTAGQTVNNKDYVYQYIVDELSKNFNTLSKNQTAQYIGQLFTASTDPGQFKVAWFKFQLNNVLLDSFKRLSHQALSIRS